jgi:hypothetical protein
MPSFHTLWNNHPSNGTPPNHAPCTDAKGNVPKALENQCAIRLGIAFSKSGISLKTLGGARCWFGHGHVLRVRDIVPWIDRNTVSIGCKKKEVHKKVSHTDFANRTGIAYFENFWGRNNQGDHVDLWDGKSIAHGDNDFFERSEQVWFWELP